LYVTLAGQVTVTVDVAWVILQAPLTEVTVKFEDPPLTVGVIWPEPTVGPTEAGLLVQLTPVVNGPVTAHADGVRVAPLYTPVKLPAVAVTAAGAIVNVAELLLLE
jgi:hypothetical protein